MENLGNIASESKISLQQQIVMKKTKYKLFEKGDIIITEPGDGYYGIAVVLDDGHCIEIDGRKSLPMCHIAITPLLFDHRPIVDEIDKTFLKPLLFDRMALYEGKTLYLETTKMVHIYTTRNILSLEVIGKIDPNLVYNGDLPWSPDSKNHKCYWCGDIGHLFGREAYIHWKRKQEKQDEID